MSDSLVGPQDVVARRRCMRRRIGVAAGSLAVILGTSAVTAQFVAHGRSERLVVAFATTSPAAFSSCEDWLALSIGVKLATSAQWLVSMRHATGELAPTDNTAPTSDRVAMLAVQIDQQCAEAESSASLAARYAWTAYATDLGLHPVST